MWAAPAAGSAVPRSPPRRRTAIRCSSAGSPSKSSRRFASTGPPYKRRVSEPLAPAAEIPTAVEAGLPRLVAEQFIGVFAPTGTPRAIVEQIAQATAAAQADPDFQQRLGTLGFQASDDSSPDKLRSVVDAEFAY